MAYVINRLCTREGDCVEVCPVECIVPGPTNDPQWNDLFFIDPDTCIDCGACVPECPVEGAITPEDEVPPEFQDDIRRNREFFASGPGYWGGDPHEERKTYTGKPKGPDWKPGVKPW
jgi:ferredoxin--NADP+ reductase